MDIIVAVFITAVVGFLYLTAMKQNARADRAEAALRRIEGTIDASAEAVAEHKGESIYKASPFSPHAWIADLAALETRIEADAVAKFAELTAPVDPANDTSALQAILNDWRTRTRTQEVAPLANAFREHALGTVAVCDLRELTEDELRLVVNLAANPIPYIVKKSAGGMITGFLEYDETIIGAASAELATRREVAK